MSRNKLPLKKIVTARIGPMPSAMSDPMPMVTVKFEDEEVRELFEFYPDEIRFAETELIGLTEGEARELKYQKDIAYLRS